MNYVNKSWTNYVLFQKRMNMVLAVMTNIFCLNIMLCKTQHNVSYQGIKKNYKQKISKWQCNNNTNTYIVDIQWVKTILCKQGISASRIKRPLNHQSHLKD